MYDIYFFKDKNGVEPIREYIENLTTNTQNKDNRIKANKIREYITYLKIHGLKLRAPYIKHINGKLWELRPLKDRIFFIMWINNSFVLLHHFTKKTQKTPKSEIEQAKRNMKKFLSDGDGNGKIYE